MRKALLALSIIAVLILSVSLTAALAEDVELQVTVKSVTAFTDKNGNLCTRFIVDEQRTLKGISYTAGVPVMAFSNMTAQVKGIKAGDTLHVIANKKLYQGNYSYTIRAVVK